MKTVERGAALLDERLPGWEDRIDLDKLDLSSTCNCVVGQLYRPTPRSHLGYTEGLYTLEIKNPSRFGFERWPTSRYSRLTEAWRRLIELRRGAR